MDGDRQLPIVSVQRVSAPDAVTGHLSWGSLLDRDVVVVPGPLEWLSGGDRRFEVLVADGGRTGPVQRFSIARVDVVGLARAPGGASAILHLNGAAEVAAMGGCFDPGSLTARIEALGDVWAALEEVGTVPVGIRERSVADVLGPVVEREILQRRDLVRTSLLKTFPPERWINPFCLFSPRCGCAPD